MLQTALAYILFSSLLIAAPLTQTPITKSIHSAALTQHHAKLGPIIPGLAQGYVPQGLCHSPQHTSFFISHYKKGHTSYVSVVHQDSQKLTTSFALHHQDASPHRGHVGGISIHNNALYIASDQLILKFELPPKNLWRHHTSLRASAQWASPSAASFCFSSPNTLFVGEFTHHSMWSKSYSSKLLPKLNSPTHPNNSAVLCLSNHKTPDHPHTFITLPSRVQGLVITPSHYILSRSYGRRNNSSIEIFSKPLTQQTSPQPLLHLLPQNKIAKHTLPPMSEGICLYKNQLVVLFESAASPYRNTTTLPIDRLVFLPLNTLLTPAQR
ncbi:hypothetical protein [Rubritalea tangerina]|uniref:Hedgehog/Intein (Hint) domain-containing protein n=1 Tax=Rubritalea tangerina TaxID=430798 RepID=A0ABW4Z990_9BACT